MKRFCHTHFWPWFWDLLLWGIALFFCGLLLSEYRPDQFLSALNLLFPLIIVPPVNALWLGLRIGPRLIWLAQRPMREELALTFIQPRQYLIHQISGPLFRALVPSIITIPLFTMVYMLNEADNFTDALVICLLSLLALADILTVCWICGRCFERLLRERIRPNTYYLIATGGSILSGVVIYFGTFYLGTFLDRFHILLSSDAISLVISFMLLVYIVFIAWILWKSLRNIVRLYFYFE